VRILEPADGTVFRVPANHSSIEIAARGEVVDAEDVGVVDFRLVWSTDRLDLYDNERVLARGPDARLWLKVPKPCQETRHVLTLSANDSASNPGKATITVVVGCYAEP
jgi:hypothetical protein